MFCTFRSHRCTFIFTFVILPVVFFALLFSNSSEDTLPWSGVSHDNHTFLVLPDSNWDYAVLRNLSIDGLEFASFNVTDDVRAVFNVVPHQTRSRAIRRALNESQQSDFYSFVAIVQNAFDRLSIPWCVHYGSLLGSFISHDLFPWDDDLDILVHGSAIELLSKLESNGSLARNFQLKYIYYDQMHKLFLSERPLMTAYNWSWPFVDVLPYVNVGQFVRNVDRSRLHRFHVPKSLFYPFQLRPFGPLWLPSPRRPWEMLSATYSHYTSFKCEENEWSHITESMRGGVLAAGCRSLQQDYAFVWRQTANNITIETLWLAERPLYSFVYHQEYSSCKHCNPFVWKFDSYYKRYNSRFLGQLLQI
ncbi:hypothetical protein CAPTEDRAFT_193433 [Capitella teleta]|uniref:LicD/FKTN/FKRP nucleotidyltransferase domain-containing protein n=1 Tax=Capitella teleta TaxID=283909 RepID=R7TU87_CAPTE|nr:hypothetical protein CAPTEDRAFT_193433 [Capitella teleta]|eukprot:ELT97473.1 hypothetical protein CAPTEDRAFT_193433 [Capitella teleta]